MEYNHTRNGEGDLGTGVPSVMCFWFSGAGVLWGGFDAKACVFVGSEVQICFLS